jgi:cellulose synthase/poly-beta-1,6-N-acetylglucosamine synthase-like glycosyltransferase
MWEYMFLLIFLWLAFFAFSFGIAGFIFVWSRKTAKKPWRLKIDNDYKPKLSVLVPTYNEAGIIRFKLENLVKVNYPKDLMQTIVVDSNSEDQTVNIVYDFIKQHPESNIQVLRQSERLGKSAALNFALKNCEGEVVIVSDADCFWPSDILEKALSFLADSVVGAVSGPKILLNPNQSWVTKSEDAYLNSMNLLKLGESKVASTLLFEGGFSAYKREALTSFDPYNTGSDDCGSIMPIIEKGYRAILIPEAYFYSPFPTSWKEKMRMKLRRANQLVRILYKYFCLFLNGRIKGSKRVVIQVILLYLVSPLMFILLMVTTIFLLLNFPYFAILFSVFLIPKVRVYLFEAVQNYLLLLLAMFSVAFGKNFMVWSKPQDRTIIQESTLRLYRLI